MDILDLRPWPERMIGQLDNPQSSLGRALSPLSALYRLGTQLHRLGVPRRSLPDTPYSIAVGNLRVGGTGKTPVTAELVRILRDSGRECAVLSRGFRSDGGGDEPAWLEERTHSRVILGSDRRKSFEEARALGVDVVVLDDAFQSRDQAHLRLCIVLAEDLIHAPRELPAGPAREPLSALDRAHALLVRRTELDSPSELDALSAFARELPRFEFRLQAKDLCDTQQNSVSLDYLTEWGSGVLVSGLARPQSLEEDALRAGAVLPIALRFSDHAKFGNFEKREIERVLRGHEVGWILSSEKNAPRLEALDLGVPIWSLRSELVWEGEGPSEWLLRQLSRA